jgi:hypothetical protein
MCGDPIVQIAAFKIHVRTIATVCAQFQRQGGSIGGILQAGAVIVFYDHLKSQRLVEADRRGQVPRRQCDVIEFHRSNLLPFKFIGPLTTTLGLFLKAERLFSARVVVRLRVIMDERKGRVSYVIGPDGSPLTLADLPLPSTHRWVIRRKAEVVAAVRGGLLSLDEACRRYTLTVEEFLAWQHAIDHFGLAGLRTTQIQQYRN